MNTGQRSIIWAFCLVLIEVCIVNAQCNGKPNVYSAGSGSINSPNYPDRYPPDQKCRWNFETPIDSHFMIVFQVIDIRLFSGSGKKKKCTGNLRIQDDEVSCKSEQPSCYTYGASNLCSTKQTSTYSKCTNNLITSSPLGVVFTSLSDKGDGKEEGFNMTFSYIDCFTDHTIYTGGSGAITSQNYPGPYNPDETYLWEFVVPESGGIILLFNITDIRLFYESGVIFSGKTCTASLTIQNDEVDCESEATTCYSYRSSSVSINQQQTMFPGCINGVIEASSVYMIFHTKADVGDEERGFNMLYSYNNVVEESDTFYSGSGDISSPNYPNPYPADQTFTWNFIESENVPSIIFFEITDIRLFNNKGGVIGVKCSASLNIQNVEVPCDSEAPSCYSFRSSGMSSIQQNAMYPECENGFIRRNTLEVKFISKSNVGNEEKGFKMTYSFVNVTEPTTIAPNPITTQTTEQTSIHHETDKTSKQTSTVLYAGEATSKKEVNFIMIGVAVLSSILILVGIIVLVIMMRKRSQPTSAEDMFPTRHRDTPSTRPVYMEPPPTYDALFRSSQYGESSTYQELHSDLNTQAPSSDNLYHNVALDSRMNQSKRSNLNNNQSAPEYDNLNGCVPAENDQSNQKDEAIDHPAYENMVDCESVQNSAFNADQSNGTAKPTDQSDLEHVSGIYANQSHDVIIANDQSDCEQTNNIYDNQSQSVQSASTQLDPEYDSLVHSPLQTNPGNPNPYDLAYESSSDDEDSQSLNGVDNPTLEAESPESHHCQ